MYPLISRKNKNNCLSLLVFLDALSNPFSRTKKRWVYIRGLSPFQFQRIKSPWSWVRASIKCKTKLVLKFVHEFWRRKPILLTVFSDVAFFRASSFLYSGFIKQTLSRITFLHVSFFLSPSPLAGLSAEVVGFFSHPGPFGVSDEPVEQEREVSSAFETN